MATAKPARAWEKWKSVGKATSAVPTILTKLLGWHRTDPVRRWLKFVATSWNGTRA